MACGAGRARESLRAGQSDAGWVSLAAGSSGAMPGRWLWARLLRDTDTSTCFSVHPLSYWDITCHIGSDRLSANLARLTRISDGNEASARRPRRVEAQLLGRRGRRCVEELERLPPDVHRQRATGGSRRARRCAALWCCRVLCCGADAWRRDIGIQCARRRNICGSEEKQKVLVVARSPFLPAPLALPEVIA